MAFLWSKPNYSPIGVDFGTDRIKLLQIIPSDPPQLIAAASVELPEAARQDPTARLQFITDSLRDLLASGPFKGRRAICAIPAFQTLIQHLQIARAEGEDFEGQIGLQLRQRLNIDPSRMVVRHFNVAQIVRDGTPKQEVLCLAASREAVLRYIDCARRARLDVVGMHAEPQAILRAFDHLYRRNDDATRTTCFLDIGGATTKVVIAHGPEMVFAKTIHAAGDHFTKALAQARDVGFMEARKMRMAQASGAAGAPPEPAPVAAAVAETSAAVGTGNPILDAQIAAENRPAAAPRIAPEPQASPIDHGDALDCLIDELQLCLRYHQTVFPGRNVEKLVFLGGESRHVATCQKIARALRTSAQLGDPLARVVQFTRGKQPEGVDMREPQPGWAVPMGLCLSEANV